MSERILWSKYWNVNRPGEDKMHNGSTTTKSTAFAKLKDAAPLLNQRPSTWAKALELARVARGWSQKQLISEALKGENVSTSDVKRWELARAWPTLNQMNKLRAAMPELIAFEDLCRLELRMDTRRKTAPLPSVKPEGWPGPPVKHFGEALKWARVAHGMTQLDLSRLVGIVSMSQWEREGHVMVRGSYEKLCEILPELRFAPPPKFSAKYQNQFRAKGYLVAQEMHQEMARAAKVVDAEAAARAPAPIKQTAAELDRAPLNTAGANYGVLRAAVIGLKAELESMMKRHQGEQMAKLEEIEKAEKAVADAEEHMLSAAKTLHRGAP